MVFCLSVRGAVEKLRNADDAFRRQLETLQASHQTELLHLINDKQKQIELANHKVKLLSQNNVFLNGCQQQK